MWYIEVERWLNFFYVTGCSALIGLYLRRTLVL